MFSFPMAGLYRSDVGHLWSDNCKCFGYFYPSDTTVLVDKNQPGPKGGQRFLTKVYKRRDGRNTKQQ